MSIENHNFDLIEEADLQTLVEAQVPESLRLEYKLNCYGSSDSEKKELLKDVSAMSNSQGGHLILGVKEAAGVPVGIEGLEIDADSEILRIEQILRSAIDPPISGIRIKSIKLQTGKHVLLLRVPRSWNPPHRVTAKNTNRFYTRHSAGVHEPSIDELRTLFTQTLSGMEKAKSFRAQRIEQIVRGEVQKPLVGEGRLILHIVPLAALTSQFSIDLEEAFKIHQQFWPIGPTGTNPKFNFHGYISERGDEENHGYTQLYRNGCIEATKAKIVKSRNGNPIIPALPLEEDIFAKLPGFINGLKTLGTPTPLILLLTLEGVSGSEYGISNNPWDDERPRLEGNPIFLPECVVEDYGDVIDYHKALQPAIDALWNSAGYSKSQSFDKNGMWVG
ncbi:MAG: ATP-binding protein [Pseudohongiellaceae bacterium]